MMAFLNSACFFLWAVFLLSFVDAAPAPVAEGDLAQSQALDIHSTDASSSRCYYNFQHYEEGDRIVTNEPCLNCTCHKRMLMCYLRVCPFTKPVGQDCTVEKKPDQCCPVITCPQVPVDIVSSSTTEAAASSSSAVGYASKYGCMLEDNTFYPDGVQMPSDPKKPCELCYCIRNHTACVRQECTLNVEGCRPVYQDGVCCPVRYDCDYQELTTTERPTTGGLLLGSTASPSQQCRYGDTLYNDGELIETDKPCESCYCMRGDIVCAVRSCGEPMEGKNCKALPPPQGQCCPTTFQCENGTVSIDNMATESSIIMKPSPIENDLSTKGPDPQLIAGEVSDDKGEGTDKTDEVASSTEISPSETHKEDENKEGSHPGEHIFSEPTDADDLEDEEALDIHSPQENIEGETKGPEISEQLSTSAPDTSDKVVTESNTVSEIHTAEESTSLSTGLNESELNQKEKESENKGQESVGDKIKADDSESAGTEGENVVHSNESTPEKQENVPETTAKGEESSTDKLENDVVHEVSESTEAETIAQSSESEQPKQPTLEKDPIAVETEDKKEVSTVTSEETPAVIPTENVGADNTENSQPEVHTGVETDETKTEANHIIPSAGDSSADIKPQAEKEDESSTTENEIKFEETPAKVPESLDQVKETEISQDNVETSTDQLPGTSEESTPSVSENKQEENDKKVNEEVEATPKTPSVEGVEESGTSEESNPEQSGHFHKEQAPPRKEDASPEEIEHHLQHAEGSMTKAEDSIPDDEIPTDQTITETPTTGDKSDEKPEPSDAEKLPDDVPGSSSAENDDKVESQEGQDQEPSVLQTEQPITNEASEEPHLEHEPSPASEVPESSGEPSESVTSPATNDIVENSDSAATTENKSSSESPSNESESVPTVIVIEPESETSTDSLPEESIHGEVKPETAQAQDGIHDPENNSEDEHQPLQTEQPVEAQTETKEDGMLVQPEIEKQPTGENNVESGNVSAESPQGSPDVNAVENSVKEETTEKSPLNENKVSSESSDSIEPSENIENESENVTDGTVISDIPSETERGPTEGEHKLPEANTSKPDREDSVSQSETNKDEGLPNEIKPNEEHGYVDEKTVEPTIEETTDTLIKTGSEAKPVDIGGEKGEEAGLEAKPIETVENPTPQSGLAVEEVHHDPVESEPTEFDENEFEDHDSTFENEITDDQLSGHGGSIGHEKPSVVPGPIGIIPGEGDCLVEGQTYSNNSVIPSKSPCHKECTCISSIVHCQGIDCPAPPPELANCMPIHQGDLCCPVYTCDGNTPTGQMESHNQMGGNVDHVKEAEQHTSDTSPAAAVASGSDIKEETPTEEITPTEKSETVLPSENSESEAEREPPVKTEGQGSHSTDSKVSGESISANPDEVKPETLESNKISVEEQENTPSPNTSVRNEEESSDEKLEVENVTTKLDVSGEDSKPDSEAESSDVVPAEGEKETGNAVLTDESETTPAETTSEESPSKPDEKITGSDQVIHTNTGENVQPQEHSTFATEIPQIDVAGETHEAEEHAEVDSNNSLEITTQISSDSVDENVPAVTEKISEQDVESSSAEEIQPEKEKDSPSTEIATQESESDQKASEEPHISDETETENEIVTEAPTASQDEHVNQNNYVTQEPSEPHLLVTSKPNLEKPSQESESASNEGESEPTVNSKPDTDGSSESSSHEESVTEVVVKPTEGSFEQNKQTSEGEGVPTVTKDETVPSTIDDDASSEQKPLDEQKTEEVKPDNEQSNQEPSTEVVTSQSVENSEAEGSNNAESSDVTAPSHPEVEGSNTDEIHAPEGAVHDDSGETGGQNEEITESILDSQPGLSTQPPSFDGPSTKAPPFVAEHIEDTSTGSAEEPNVPHDVDTETTEPNSVETSLPHAAHVNITVPESDNLVIDSTQTPSSTQPEKSHDQESETSSENQDKLQISEKHKPETQEISQTTGSETSENVNEIGENISESPSHEPQQPENEADTENTKHQLAEDSQVEGETTHLDGDHDEAIISNNSDESPALSTATPIEESDNKDKETVHEESGPVQEGGEFVNSEDEKTTEHLEPVHEETEHAHDESETVHEESEPVQEESGPTHEESEPAHEGSESVHEGAEPAHEGSESVNEGAEPAHEGSGSSQEESEPAHEGSDSVHEGSGSSQEESEPAHEGSEPAHEGSQPSQGESEPAHDGSEPAQEESEPAHEGSEPAHEGSESAHEGSEPAHEGSEPAHEGSEPAHEGSEPAHEGSEPAHEGSEPAHEGSEPAHEGSEPAHEESEPVHEGSEPAHEGSESVHEGSEPAHEGSEPAQEGSEPAHEGSEPTHDGSEPAHEGSEPAQEGSEPAHEGSEPAHEGSEPAHEGSEPAHEGSEPAHEGSEPTHDGSEPAHEGSGPAHEGSEPAHEGSEPTHDGSEPAQEGSEPTQGESEPAQEESEPVHEDAAPAHEESEPVHEITEQPAHEQTESANEESEPVHEETGVTHEETESSHEETEQPHEETELANAVPDQGETLEQTQETAGSVNEADQSTTVPDSSENVPEETDHEEEQPNAETEHSIPEHSDTLSEHPDSEHSEPNHQNHETVSPEGNIIGEVNPPIPETDQGVHETENAVHETGTHHTQGSGSLPSMEEAAHPTDNLKPHHSKPDEPELPPEDQFTPDVDMDYDVSEDGAFGPGTCRYGGKVYVSAQQIPRDDPCDFCFCFRSDIICLQQSCPPPIHRCHQEPIQGYCCPRYQCPVSMATSLNITTTTSTTTTTLPPHFFAHAYRGAARQSGCFHRGRAYEVGEEIASASGPCLQCICGSDGQMRCDPKVCNPEPMVRKLMEAAVSHRRR